MDAGEVVRAFADLPAGALPTPSFLVSTLIEIEAAFEKLSLREKEEFALWYEERLANVGPDPEIDQLWSVEIQRRLEEIRSGQVQAIPGEQVMADLRRRYGV